MTRATLLLTAWLAACAAGHKAPPATAPVGSSAPPADQLSLPAVRIVPQMFHGGDVGEFDVSADARLAVTWTDEGEAGVWSLESGLLLRTLTLGKEVSPALAPDGRHVAAASARAIELWDLSTGQSRKLATLDGLGVRGLEYRRGGSWLSVQGEDLHLATFDAASGQRLSRVGPVSYYRVFFQNDERLLSFDQGPGEPGAQPDVGVSVWDLKSGRRLVSVAGDFRSDRDALAVSENGRVAVAALDGQGAIVFSVADGAVLSTLTGVRPPLVLSPSGDRLAVVREGGAAVFETADGRLVRELPNYEAPFLFTRDGKLIADGNGYADDREMGLRLIDLGSGQVLQRYKFTNAIGVEGLREHPGGLLSARAHGFASRGHATRVWLWSLDATEPLDEAHEYEENPVWIERVVNGRLHAVLRRPSYENQRGALEVYKPGRGGKALTLDPRVAATTDVAVARDGSFAVTARADGTLARWDFATLSPRWVIQPFENKITDVVVSDDGRRIAVAWATTEHASVALYDDDDEDFNQAEFMFNEVELLDAQTGERLKTENMNSWGVRGLSITPDGERVAYLKGADDKRSRLSFLKSDEVRELPVGLLQSQTEVAFLPDGHLFINNAVVDVQSGRVLETVPAEPCREYAHLVALSADGSRIVVDCEQKWLSWDRKRGRAEPLPFGGGPKAHGTLSADGKLFLWWNEQGQVELWQLEPLKKAAAPSFGAFTDARLLGDGSYAYLVTLDGADRLVRVRDGQWVGLVTSNDAWVAYGDGGYFDAARNAGRLVSAVRGLQAYPIDQVAPFYNRPDVLLERMGLGSPELVGQMRALYEKRLRKLRAGSTGTIDLDAAPTAQIRRFEQSGRFLDLSVDFQARASTLQSWNVYVNGVRLFGARGKPLTGQQRSETARLELGDGTNKIEVSATNAAGVESLRDIRSLTFDVRDCKDCKRERKVYFLGFGVSRYRDARLNLDYAHKDALDLGEVFRAMSTKEHPVEVKVFTDEAVSPSAFREARELLRGAGVDDLVVVFVAGHGAHSRTALGDYYFVAHATDPNQLEKTGIPFTEIEQLVDDIAPRHKLLLLDTCESGDDVEAGAPPPPLPGARGLKTRAVRGLALRASGPARAAAPALLDRSRYIASDLFRRTGTVVLSSSKGAEASFEQAELQNGAFTEELLRALTSADADGDRDRTLSMPELYAFVAAKVEQRTAGQQHPVIDRDNLDANLTFPLAPGAAGIVHRSLR